MTIRKYNIIRVIHISVDPYFAKDSVYITATMEADTARREVH